MKMGYFLTLISSFSQILSETEKSGKTKNDWKASNCQISSLMSYVNLCYAKVSWIKQCQAILLRSAC